MSPGDLVRINLPSRYSGISHVDRFQGKIGFVTEVEVTGTNWMMTLRAHVLVEGDVRQFDIRYLESVDETR
jgi:ribosomal protein L21E